MKELEEKEADEAFVEEQMQAISNVTFKATSTYFLQGTQNF